MRAILPLRPLLILLNAVDGAIDALDMPCRQAFVAEMIEKKEDLGDAIAPNSSMVNAARMIGPAAVGVFAPGLLPEIAAAVRDAGEMTFEVRD